MPLETSTAQPWRPQRGPFSSSPGGTRPVAIRHASPSPSHVRGHRSGLVIGDSTGIFATPILALLGLEADSRECRQFAEGVAIVRRRRAAGTLPHLVVLALGANGPVSTAQIDGALVAIGPRRVLGLVTPRNLASSAASMRSEARRRPDRVVLIDWRRRSAGHGAWFSSLLTCAETSLP